MQKGKRKPLSARATLSFEHYKFPPVMLVCRDAAYFKDEGRWQVAVRVIRRPND